MFFKLQLYYVMIKVYVRKKGSTLNRFNTKSGLHGYGKGIWGEKVWEGEKVGVKNTIM